MSRSVVAKRCKSVSLPEDRALVYWLQAQSHKEGGLKWFAECFIDIFADRLGTMTSRRIGKAPGDTYTPEESKAIRAEMPATLLAADFLPKRVPADPNAYLTWQFFGAEWKDETTGRTYSQGERDFLVAEYETAKAEAEAPLPCLTVNGVLKACQMAASKLPEILSIMCLDPEAQLESMPFTFRWPGGSGWQYGGQDSIWWFLDLVGALQIYRFRHAQEACYYTAETTISKKVFEALDYVPKIDSTAKFVIVEGDQRTGKTTAAKAWCAKHPGQAVYISLESGRDNFTFFRSIARAIGTASSGQMKAVEMRMKIEDMLQEGHLTVVIDEAHYLFPLVDRPKSAPDRMDWVRTALVDHGVPVALVATPQFDKQCALWHKSIGWNAAQIKGRVKLHAQLPTELPLEDLEAVALKMAPEADKPSLLRLAGFAQASDDYLAGIERLVCRAKHFASQDRRETANRADIKRALDEAAPQIESSLPPCETPKPKRRASSVRTTPSARGAKRSGKTLPLASGRCADQDMPADKRSAGLGASERLLFTEAAASE